MTRVSSQTIEVLVEGGRSSRVVQVTRVVYISDHRDVSRTPASPCAEVCNFHRSFSLIDKDNHPHHPVGRVIFSRHVVNGVSACQIAVRSVRIAFNVDNRELHPSRDGMKLRCREPDHFWEVLPQESIKVSRNGCRAEDQLLQARCSAIDNLFCDWREGSIE